MRTKLFMLVVLLAFAALMVIASPAAAWPGPHHRLFPATTQAAPVPAADLVPKTPAMLGASSYPWAQPVWTRVHGVVLVIAPIAIQSVPTESRWIGLS
jgi:hypothetical protein